MNSRKATSNCNGLTLKSAALERGYNAPEVNTTSHKTIGQRIAFSQDKDFILEFLKVITSYKATGDVNVRKRPLV